jgi:2-isopropylmalate synthase
VHCHNDTGLATANTLAAIKNGADKVECTINGIGERAGNAALEEVVMALKLRQSYYNASTNILTKEIKKTSNLVSSLMGLDVQVNKAITGDNAFAHSSGIHQDGLLKSRDAYEVIHPEDVGVDNMEMVLTARSGRHAVKDALLKIGFQEFLPEDFEKVFAKFLELADIKKEVYNHDLFHIVESSLNILEDKNEDSVKVKGMLFQLVDLQVISNNAFPSASIKIMKGTEVYTASAVGDGVIDALYTAIRNVIGIDIDLIEYKIASVSKGKEALGRVSIQVSHNGKSYRSKAVDTDVLKASAIAFINAANTIVLDDIFPKNN